MSMARWGALSLALAATFVFMVGAADARVSSGGSRGNRTFNTPPTTNTAPKPAQPIERSMTQPGTSTVAQGPRAPSPAAAPSRFGSGFGGLLMGGLLGAGLFGLLSGAGLFGGLSGFASFLGLALQVALIAGAAYLIMGYFRSRNQPALAGAASGPGSASLRDRLGGYGQGLGGLGGSAAPELAIGKADYDAFEKLLGDIQTAYAREDVDALGDMTTPEMLSYYSQDLADDKRKGIRYEVSNVKLLQGDLAESWQEPGTDYATVAMRFSMIDVTLDRATGRVVDGDRTNPEEVTQLWTFRRDHRDMAEGWKLSAVQDA
ncbi:MAG: TIM44-like domain-containing protein [Rhodospirillales bacterium]|nr:TIM44-like domain-containing protein [Rhodospirillales bacterium]